MNNLKKVAEKELRFETSLLAKQKELVEEIQSKLIDLNLLNLPVDGVFGPLTAAALREFQAKSLSSEIGYFGSNTAIKLLSARSAQFTKLRIKTTHKTFFKQKPLQSDFLSICEKEEVEVDEYFDIISFAEIRNHIHFYLKNKKIKEKSSWWGYNLHLEVYEEDTRIFPKAPPESVRLNVFYKSQLDNYYNPTGSCNVTSIAMCLSFLGVESEFGQLEDELYEYALTKGYSRHSPYDLAKIVRDYGKKDIFKSNSNIDEVKDWLRKGYPVVLHGYFTDFGHIIVAVGFDENGLLIHDPYGEWFSTGYRTDLSGKYLNYSYELVTRICMPDGKLWAHFISD